MKAGVPLEYGFLEWDKIFIEKHIKRFLLFLLVWDKATHRTPAITLLSLPISNPSTTNPSSYVDVIHMIPLILSKEAWSHTT